MRAREAELRARLDGRAIALADELDDGDEVLVDGRPVAPGQVIVLQQIRDRDDGVGVAAHDHALAAELGAALSPDRVRVGATELGLYGRDASNIEGRAGVVCFPTTTAEVQACVRLAVAHDVPFIARGSGTGLAGGATPLDDAIVIVTTKMNRVLSVDPVHRLAWVEPGVLNLDLTRAVTLTACTSRPTRAASRAARSAATWPTTPVVRTASPTA